MSKMGFIPSIAHVRSTIRCHEASTLWREFISFVRQGSRLHWYNRSKFNVHCIFRTNYYYISKHWYWRKLDVDSIAFIVLKYGCRHLKYTSIITAFTRFGFRNFTVYQIPGTDENSRVNLILTTWTIKRNYNLHEPSDYSGLDVFLWLWICTSLIKQKWSIDIIENRLEGGYFIFVSIFNV